MKEILLKYCNNLIFLTEMRKKYTKTKNPSIKKYHTDYCYYKMMEKVVIYNSQISNKLSFNNRLTEENNISNASSNDSRRKRPPPQNRSINYNNKRSNIPPPQDRAHYEILNENKYSDIEINSVNESNESNEIKIPILECKILNDVKIVF